MKKYLTLGIITLVLMFAVLLIPRLASQMLPSVKVTSMKTDRYSKVIYATGSVEEREKTDVTSEFPLVIKKINTAVGKQVKAGDVLMEVDKEATKELLLKLASNALSSSGTSLTVSLLQTLGEYSADQLLALIPSTVTAPKSGIVSRVEATKNRLIFPGESLAAISNGKGLVASLAVAETDISAVVPEQSVSLSGISEGGQTIYGKVYSISSSARKQLSGTSFETVVDVIVEIDSDETTLKPGYTIKAEIQVEQPRQINLLPYDAVGQDENGEEYVYVYNAKTGTAVRRWVVSGAETANGIEIVKGVYPSDPIIFDVSTVSGDGGYISVQGRVG